MKKILGQEAISLHRLRQSFMAFMESRSFAHENRNDLQGAEQQKPDGRAHAATCAESAAVGGRKGASKVFSALFEAH